MLCNNQHTNWGGINNRVIYYGRAKPYVVYYSYYSQIGSYDFTCIYSLEKHTMGRHNISVYMDALVSKEIIDMV